MKEIIDLSKAGHALTTQIKQLHLESQNGHSGIYKVYTKTKIAKFIIVCYKNLIFLKP